MSIVEFLKVIILGIVEGITEWLPISSTGHLILADEFIQLDVTPEFMEMFRVVIQLGAILAVVCLYFSRLWPFRNQKEASNAWERYVDMDKMVLWFKIIVACLPAVAIGLPFDDLLIIENYNAKRTPKVTDLKDLTFRTAFLIGVFQVLSLIPGTSRSGSTIIGGILLGTSRTVAAEFTFFLAIPVMFGASLLKLIKFGLHFTGAEALILLVGMLTAFLVSILAIKFLMGYIKKHDFKVFGWYRIVLGVLVFGYFIGKNLLA